eukprot:TRINITY_DN3248_c0_g1_i4.p1 TRINITY_DN3248_c0_g1~~TRINITY_DN3248_c0_g1_i4.p1  ORF type:complete len:636 (-),score=86.15 TRINITY_DN3248_c0_g1_i4:26-1801(-)
MKEAEIELGCAYIGSLNFISWLKPLSQSQKVAQLHLAFKPFSLENTEILNTIEKFSKQTQEILKDSVISLPTLPHLPDRMKAPSLRHFLVRPIMLTLLNNFEKDPNFHYYLSGNSGQGKSFILYFIALVLYHRGWVVFYMPNGDVWGTERDPVKFFANTTSLLVKRHFDTILPGSQISIGRVYEQMLANAPNAVLFEEFCQSLCGLRNVIFICDRHNKLVPHLSEEKFAPFRAIFQHFYFERAILFAGSGNNPLNQEIQKHQRAQILEITSYTEDEFEKWASNNLEFKDNQEALANFKFTTKLVPRECEDLRFALSTLPDVDKAFAEYRTKAGERFSNELESFLKDNGEDCYNALYNYFYHYQPLSDPSLIDRGLFKKKENLFFPLTPLVAEQAMKKLRSKVSLGAGLDKLFVEWEQTPLIFERLLIFSFWRGPFRLKIQRDQQSTEILVNVQHVVNFDDLGKGKVADETLILVRPGFTAIDFAYVDNQRKCWLFQATIAKDPWTDHMPRKIKDGVPMASQKNWIKSSTSVVTYFNYYVTGNDANIKNDTTLTNSALRYVLISTQKDVALPRDGWAFLCDRKSLEGTFPWI